jgi:hypothetical protein
LLPEEIVLEISPSLRNYPKQISRHTEELIVPSYGLIALQ